MLLNLKLGLYLIILVLIWRNQGRISYQSMLVRVLQFGTQLGPLKVLQWRLHTLYLLNCGEHLYKSVATCTIKWNVHSHYPCGNINQARALQNPSADVPLFQPLFYTAAELISCKICACFMLLYLTAQSHNQWQKFTICDLFSCH